MPDEIDWKLTTYEGNRLRQHRAFQALPFREKLERLEQMAEVASQLARRRGADARPDEAAPSESGGRGAEDG